LSTDNLTFVHGLSRRVQVMITVKDGPPTSGQISNLIFEWIGRPKPKPINEYRQWILSVVQALADRWNISILYALRITPNQREVWRIAANELLQLIEKLNIGIP
jgi:hypothetical protein